MRLQRIAVCAYGASIQQVLMETIFISIIGRLAGRGEEIGRAHGAHADTNGTSRCGALALLGHDFVQQALIAAALLGLLAGLIGPFIVMRQMSFAVHGSSELSLTGAAFALLVMSLLITPAAAAARLVASPAAIAASVVFAEISAVGGIVLSLAPGVPVSVFVATISFLIYLFCWLLGRRREAAA